MPIRFRCAHCDQLLGIAHRKAGTVVKCPNCAGQVVVPTPDPARDDPSDPDSPTARAADAPAAQLAAVPEKAAPAPQPAGGMLFERSDFDELLKPALERREPAAAGKSARSSRRPPTPADAFRFNDPAPVVPAAAAPPVPPVPAAAPNRPRGGILLSPVKLVVLAVLVVAGLAFAFGGGLLLGMILGKRG